MKTKQPRLPGLFCFRFYGSGSESVVVFVIRISVVPFVIAVVSGRFIAEILCGGVIGIHVGEIVKIVVFRFRSLQLFEKGTV